jgi:glycosyltransferase involved in cell wall biosynthesis
MALGVPVVASRHGGPVDIIEEGRDGLLFRPGDVEDLAEKIVSLLEDPALSRRLAEAAMTKVRTQYTMEALVSQIQRAYDRLLLGRRPRRPA